MLAYQQVHSGLFLLCPCPMPTQLKHLLLHWPGLQSEMLALLTALRAHHYQRGLLTLFLALCFSQWTVNYGRAGTVLPRVFLVLNSYKVLNKCLLNNCIWIKFRKVFYKSGLLSTDTIHDQEKTTWQEETFDSFPNLSRNISGSFSHTNIHLCLLKSWAHPRCMQLLFWRSFCINIH